MGATEHFAVHLADEAWKQIEAQVRYIAVENHAPLNASRWLDRLLDAIATLENFPLRCPLDQKQSTSHGVAVHVMVFEQTYLLRYVVDEVSRQVIVVSFRHGAQQQQP